MGALNRRLSGNQGRANALYVLFYYAGGWIGITLCGLAYGRFLWNGVVVACLLMLAMPLLAGWSEWRQGAGEPLSSTG